MELHHKFHTNKCESLNNVITVMCPKRKHYSSTVNGEARTYASVSINSVGTKEYYRRLSIELGMSFTPVMDLSYRRIDKLKRQQKEYSNLPKYKKKRAEINAKKIRAAVAVTHKDYARGMGYGTGIALDGRTNPSAVTPAGQSTPRVPQSQRVCPHCNRKGHVTTRSKKCGKYAGGTGGNTVSPAVPAPERQPPPNPDMLIAAAFVPIDNLEPDDEDGVV
jgi:hypothetical protein